MVSNGIYIVYMNIQEHTHILGTDVDVDFELQQLGTLYVHVKVQCSSYQCVQ